MMASMIAPRCLIVRQCTKRRFQADFVGSGKWFRRQSSILQRSADKKPTLTVSWLMRVAQAQ
jgi:hypothetical protein